MVVDAFSPLNPKRRKLTYLYSMANLADMTERFGREIRVFETSPVSPSLNAAPSNEGDETDDFYEFTPEDYYRLLATKKEGEYETIIIIKLPKYLTRNAHCNFPVMAVIRVRFPDNHTLEANFHPSETIQSLVDLMTKVIVQPEQPFHLYTTPPKKVIKDMSQDFYTAGFCPGAIVYFSYDVPKGDNTPVGPYLREDIMALKDLHVSADQGQQSEPAHSEPEPVVAPQPPPVQERKPAEKKLVKPKWLKM
ncbi:Plant UBX domain-containing protein 1 [Stylosanthes scabra]|uniref:Plant UBX domain-containing protein 1 n=1 Tax=Stylosanthes scabra TaxID=79078 RepID=A0ABU6ZK94_9FABA|nr:Plant UBX domain-containing protein 1 [Stylosanthes scabra]